MKTRLERNVYREMINNRDVIHALDPQVTKDPDRITVLIHAGHHEALIIATERLGVSPQDVIRGLISTYL